MMQDKVLKVIVFVCEGALLHMLVTILKGSTYVSMLHMLVALQGHMIVCEGRFAQLGQDIQVASRTNEYN